MSRRELTRKKFDNSFPINSINFCLEKAKIDETKINKIIFYENPDLKFERIVQSLSNYKTFNFFDNLRIIKDWFDNKYHIDKYINKYLPNYNGEILFSEHHISHAASAYYPSPFDDSSIIVLDGVGEWASSSILRGDKNNIEILKQQNFPNSLGILYSAFTSYLGFKVLSGEYKLMGLAPYGEPKYYSKIKDEILEINTDGTIEINEKYFNFLDEKKIYNNKFNSLFDNIERKSSQEISNEHCNLASSIQKIIEEIIFLIVKNAQLMTGSNNLCLSGGVALNCVANGKIKENSNIKNIWIQPASGDAGGALGACLYYLYGERKFQRNKDENIQQYSYLGPSYNDDQIEDNLKAHDFKFKKYELQDASQKISNFLQEGKVIGLFQSKMEFGPRALGNRSIIGDPRVKDLQKKKNLKIKFRESFRPFAPAILKEHVTDWFKFDGSSPYMLMTCQIKDKKKLPLNSSYIKKTGLNKISAIRSQVPSVTHVDNSARIQTVTEEANNIFYNIINKFYEDTNCPILINTSFNVRSEPIVCSPFDALKCFMNTDIDILYIGNFILNKNDQGNKLVDEDFLKFDLD